MTKKEKKGENFVFPTKMVNFINLKVWCFCLGETRSNDTRKTFMNTVGCLSTMTVLLDAQRQQQQALTQRNTAISEYLQAKTRYLIVTGRRTY